MTVYSNKLETVLQTYLQIGKNEMPMAKLFSAYEDNDKAALAQVGEYCMIDSVRLQQLVYCGKTKIFESLISLALVVYCPLEYIHHRGQQVKVMAQLARTATKLGFEIPDTLTDFTLGDCRPRMRFDDNGMICNNAIIPQMPTTFPAASDEHEEDEDEPTIPSADVKLKAKAKQYEGAIVLDPREGFYYPKINLANGGDELQVEPDARSAHQAIAVFDFASLYPMQMISNNICYSTLVLDREYVQQLKAKGYVVDEHEWIDGETHQPRYVGFVQNVKAVLPTLLTDLYAERKKIKKDMVYEQDQIRHNLLDKRQLAVKVSLNSVYGFPASQMLSCGIISATVCYLGRSEKAGLKRVVNALVNDWPGTEIIYGDTDSVFVSLDAYKHGPPKTLGELASLCTTITADITAKYFRAPMCLEFEKIYTFFKLYSKKRYEGLKYEVDATASRSLGRPTLGPYKLDGKGVILKKRDSIPIAKEVYAEINRLHMLGGANVMAESVTHLQKIITGIMEMDLNTINLNDFAISKKINGNYRQPFENPQSVVAEKCKARGQDVRPNDYVKYVVLEDVTVDSLPPAMRDYVIANEKHKSRLPITFRSEDLTFAIENSLVIDRFYYIQKIQTPVMLLFDINGVPEDIQQQVRTIFYDALAGMKKQKVKGTAFQQAGVRNAKRTEWGNDDRFGGDDSLSDELKNAVLEELAYFQHDHQSELKKLYGDSFKLRVDFQDGVTKRVHLSYPIIDILLPGMQYCLPHKRVHNRTATNGSVPFRLQITSGGIRIQCLKQGDGCAWPTKDDLLAKGLKPGLRSDKLATLMRLAHNSIHGISEMPVATQPNTTVTKSTRTVTKKRKVIDKAANNAQMTSFFTKKPKVIDMSIIN